MIESITRSKRKVLELHPDWKSNELVEHQKSKTRGIKEWLLTSTTPGLTQSW